MKFAITGLPRTRTAWLSQFLTYKNNCCLHDAARGCSSMGDYNKKVHWVDGDASCSHLLMPPTWFEKNKIKLVIIERPYGEVSASMFSMDGVDSMDDVDTYLRLLRKRLRLFDCMEALRVPFSLIDKNIEQIWQWCYPSELFPAQRHEQMKDMVIRLERIDAGNDIQIRAFSKDLEELNELYGSPLL